MRLLPLKLLPVVLLLFALLVSATSVRTEEIEGEFPSDVLDQFYSHVVQGDYGGAIGVVDPFLDELDIVSSGPASENTTRRFIRLAHYSLEYSDWETANAYLLRAAKHFSYLTENLAASNDSNLALRLEGLRVLYEHARYRLALLRDPANAQDILSALMRSENTEHAVLIDDYVSILLDYAVSRNWSGDQEGADVFLHRALSLSVSRRNIAMATDLLLMSHLASTYAQSNRGELARKVLKEVYVLLDRAVISEVTPEGYKIAANLVVTHLLLGDLSTVSAWAERYEKAEKNLAHWPAKPYLDIKLSQFYVSCLQGDIVAATGHSKRLKKHMNEHGIGDPDAPRLMQIGLIFAKINSGLSPTPADVEVLSQPVDDPGIERFRLLGLAFDAQARSDKEAFKKSLVSIYEAVVATDLLDYRFFRKGRSEDVFDQYVLNALYSRIGQNHSELLRDPEIADLMFRLAQRGNFNKFNFEIANRAIAHERKNSLLNFYLKLHSKLIGDRYASVEDMLGRIRERWLESERISKKGTNPPVDPTINTSLESKWRKSEENLVNLQDAIFDESDGVWGAIDRPEIRLDEIKSLLRHGEALIFYDILGEIIFRCAITRSRHICQVGLINRDELEINIAEIRASVSVNTFGRPLEFPSEESALVYQALFIGLEEIIEDSNHLLIAPFPDHVSLPFNALIMSSGNSDRHRWLGLEISISVLPSMAMLTSSRRSLAARPTESIFFGVGNPSIADYDWSNLPGNSRLPALPETREELLRVSGNFRAEETELLLEDEATEQNVRLSGLDRFKIVHFATHGLVSGEFDFISEPSLILTPGADRTVSHNDGLLTATEIAEFNLNAELVVLSACNTASDTGVANTVGISDLATSFSAAGARTLLVSQWSVDSVATSILISQTVEAVAYGRYGPADALREAMLSYVRVHANQNNGELPHPYYWAPFIILGDGSTSVSLEMAASPTVDGGQEINAVFGGRDTASEFLSIGADSHNFYVTEISTRGGEGGVFNGYFRILDKQTLKHTVIPLDFSAPEVKFLDEEQVILAGYRNNARKLADGIVVRFLPDQGIVEEVFQRSTDLNNFVLDLMRKKSGYVVLSASGDFNVDESIEVQEDSVEISVLSNSFALSEQFRLPVMERVKAARTKKINGSPKIVGGGLFQFKQRIFSWVNVRDLSWSFEFNERHQFLKACVDKHVSLLFEINARGVGGAEFVGSINNFRVRSVTADTRKAILWGEKQKQCSIDSHLAAWDFDGEVAANFRETPGPFDVRLNEVVRLPDEGYLAVGRIRYPAVAASLRGAWELPGAHENITLPSLMMGSGSGSAPFLFVFSENLSRLYEHVEPDRYISVVGDVVVDAEFGRIMAVGIKNNTQAWIKSFSLKTLH